MYNEKVVTVTKEMALEFLKKNYHNRSMKRAAVARLVSDLENGRWDEPLGLSAPIMFDEHGRLRDGQHRMQMVVNSGIPVKFKIWQNVPEKTVMLVDCGERRKMPDIVKMAGGNNAAWTSASMNILNWYFSGQPLGGTHPRGMSQAEGREKFLKHRKMIEHCIERLHALGISRRPPFKPGTLLASYFIERIVSESKADEFTYYLINGEGPAREKTNAVHLMREQLSKLKRGPKNIFVYPMVEWAMIAKAWNLYYTSTNIKQFKIGSEEELPRLEPDPTYNW